MEIPKTGQFAAPPPDAPAEIAQPLSEGLIAEQLARAQQNEKTLAPFNPPQNPVPQARTVESSSDLNAAARALSEARAARQGDAPHQPAASNSDSPSRGVPKPSLDPGKEITGGFGHVGEAQYYPLTGLELQELCKGMMDEMVDRIVNDLRFSMALTYPRVQAKLTFEFSGYAQDHSETVRVVKVHDKTPLEVAQQYAGDEIVFVKRVSKQEFSDSGEAIDPPDRMRDALGLPKPAKQLVDTGGGRMLVDVPSLPGDTF